MKFLRLIGRNIKGIADWKGKASRKEFFGCVLSLGFLMVIFGIGALVLMVYSFIHKGIARFETMALSLALVCMIVFLLLMLIFPSLFVRRLNDAGCSRWFVLLLGPIYLNYIGHFFFGTYIYKLGTYGDYLNNIVIVLWLIILLITCIETKET